jgi:hypothetical protein
VEMRAPQRHGRLQRLSLHVVDGLRRV